MNEKMMIDVLQRTRHDLMNHLQVMHGYLSMDKIGVVKEKLAECIHYYNQERKLINLNAPNFILWVIQFNYNHENVHLNYHIHSDEINLSHMDDQLIEDSEFIVGRINKLGSKMELYELKLELNKISQSKVKLSITVVDQFNWINDFEDHEQNKSVCVKESDDGIVYECLYTIE